MKLADLNELPNLPNLPKPNLPRPANPERPPKAERVEAVAVTVARSKRMFAVTKTLVATVNDVVLMPMLVSELEQERKVKLVDVPRLVLLKSARFDQKLPVISVGNSRLTKL